MFNSLSVGPTFLVKHVLLKTIHPFLKLSDSTAVGYSVGASNNQISLVSRDVTSKLIMHWLP